MMIIIRRMNAFQLRKVDSVAPMLLVDTEGLDVVALVQVHVAQAHLRRQELLFIKGFSVPLGFCFFLIFIFIIIIFSKDDSKALLSCGRGEGFLLGLHVVSIGLQRIAHTIEVVVLEMEEEVSFPVEGSMASLEPARELAGIALLE